MKLSECNKSNILIIPGKLRRAIAGGELHIGWHLETDTDKLEAIKNKCKLLQMVYWELNSPLLILEKARRSKKEPIFVGRNQLLMVEMGKGQYEVYTDAQYIMDGDRVSGSNGLLDENTYSVYKVRCNRLTAVYHILTFESEFIDCEGEHIDSMEINHIGGKKHMRVIVNNGCVINRLKYEEELAYKSDITHIVKDVKKAHTLELTMIKGQNILSLGENSSIVALRLNILHSEDDALQLEDVEQLGLKNVRTIHCNYETGNLIKQLLNSYTESTVAFNRLTLSGVIWK